MNVKINDSQIFKYLPYLIIIMFTIFCTCMVLEIHDINEELEQFKKVIAEYKKHEIAIGR